MKLVFAIFRYFPYGGLQKDFLRIAGEAASRGHEVICFTNRWDGEIPSFLRVEYAHIRALTNHGAMRRFETALGAFLERVRPDRSLAFSRTGGTDFFFAGDDCFAALTAARKNPFLRFLPRTRAYLTLERHIFGKDSSVRILYLTERQKKAYQQYYGTDDARFLYLPPSGSPGCFRTKGDDLVRARKRRELGLKDDDVMLLEIASDFPCKGVDRTIRAAAALPDELRRNVRLFLVGGGSEAHRRPFVRLTEESGIADRTVFTGARDDVKEFLLAADLVVHPARKEAAGIVLYESLAAETPLICTDVCGYAPLVRESGCPVLEGPFSQEALDEALRRLLSGGDVLRLRERLHIFSGSLPRTPREKTAADILLA